MGTHCDNRNRVYRQGNLVRGSNSKGLPAFAVRRRPDKTIDRRRRSQVSASRAGFWVRAGGCDHIPHPQHSRDVWGNRPDPERPIRGLIRTDSIATIGTQGVVGETFLSISPGSSRAAEAVPLATLRSQEVITLPEMLDRGSGLLDTVDGTIKETRVKLDRVLDGLSYTLPDRGSDVGLPVQAIPAAA
jgi:hypothetical protein